MRKREAKAIAKSRGEEVDQLRQVVSNLIDRIEEVTRRRQELSAEVARLVAESESRQAELEGLQVALDESSEAFRGRVRENSDLKGQLQVVEAERAVLQHRLTVANCRPALIHKGKGRFECPKLDLVLQFAPTDAKPDRWRMTDTRTGHVVALEDWHFIELIMADRRRQILVEAGILEDPAEFEAMGELPSGEVEVLS